MKMLNEKITRMIGSAKLGAKKYAPEILLTGGAIAGAGAMVAMHKAGTKADKIWADFESSKNSVDEVLHTAGLTREEERKLVTQVYSKHALELVKTYALPVGLYAAAVGMIFASYKIQKNRQISLSMALAGCTKAYNDLKTRLANGAANGLTAQEILDGVQTREVVDPETGEVTIEKYITEGIEDPGTVRFDRYSTQWADDHYQNVSTVYAEQQWANDLLRTQGYLFLNDVLTRLGLTPTKAGQILGWKWQADGDVFVDFNIVDCSTYEDVRYDDNAFDLTFNIQGDILTNF